MKNTHLTKKDSKDTTEKKSHTNNDGSISINWGRTIRLYITGFFMGTADLIPGVSGGTIAFIFGIYAELITSIKNITGKTIHLFIKGKMMDSILSIPFRFLVPLGTGILSAIVLLAKVISFLLTNYPTYVWGFFFGLVLASIALVSKRVGKWTATAIISLIIAAITTYLIVGTVPGETPANPIMFFLSGMIAICAMILPGISGSYLLLIMGKYNQILAAVTQRDLVTLGIFFAGCVVGIALFSRILSWLFKNHHDLSVAVLTGVMLGSLRKIWPWKEVFETTIDRHGDVIPLIERNILPQSLDSSFFLVLLLAVAGTVLIFWMQRINVTKEHRNDVE